VPSSWTLPDLRRFIEEQFGKLMCLQSISRVVVAAALCAYPKADQVAS